MILTRALAEGMILNRCQGILSRALGPAIIPAVGTSVTSPCAFLGWPIASALLDCRMTVADPSNPTDLECQAIVDALAPKFFDCSEYHALDAALNQFQLYEVSVGVGAASVSYANIAQQLQAAVQFKAGQIKQRYGVGMFQSGTGTIGVGQLAPHTPRPHVPPGQNWPSVGPGVGTPGGIGGIGGVGGYGGIGSGFGPGSGLGGW